MIEIDECRFGYWPNEQHTWLFVTHEDSGITTIYLQQLYAQMMGWA